MRNEYLEIASKYSGVDIDSVEPPEKTDAVPLVDDVDEPGNG